MARRLLLVTLLSAVASTSTGEPSATFQAVGNGYCRTAVDGDEGHPWEPQMECIELKACQELCSLKQSPSCAGIAWTLQSEEMTRCKAMQKPRCNMYLGDAPVQTVTDDYQEYTCYKNTAAGAADATEVAGEQPPTPAPDTATPVMYAKDAVDTAPTPAPDTATPASGGGSRAASADGAAPAGGDDDDDTTPAGKSKSTAGKSTAGKSTTGDSSSGDAEEGDCDTVCEFEGMEDTCRNRIQWSADNQYFQARSPCAKGYAQVMEDCPVCGGCSYLASSCVKHSAPDDDGDSDEDAAPEDTGKDKDKDGCSTLCEYNGASLSCRDRVEWLMDNSDDSCSASVKKVQGECAVCNHCTTRKVCNEAASSTSSAPNASTSNESLDSAGPVSPCFVDVGAKGGQASDLQSEAFTYEDKAECQLPFTHDGKAYAACTNSDRESSWCATAVDGQGEMLAWGDCSWECVGGGASTDSEAEKVPTEAAEDPTEDSAENSAPEGAGEVSAEAAEDSAENSAPDGGGQEPFDPFDAQAEYSTEPLAKGAKRGASRRAGAHATTLVAASVAAAAVLVALQAVAARRRRLRAAPSPPTAEVAQGLLDPRCVEPCPAALP